MADDFKRSYNDKATAHDFYCSYVKSSSRYRGKNKKMLHQIGRSRLKQKLIKEIKNNNLWGGEMKKLWLMTKVDISSGEVVVYDSSLPNEFLKTEI